ncbi:kinase-like domain-containing protein [Dichotomocladium elegans]|nr:kinase-like domain-containing protein [Dichotomocladium elegans]
MYSDVKIFFRNNRHRVTLHQAVYPIMDSTLTNELRVNNLRYTVLKEIGRGGTGTVYEVLSHRHQEKFALKCISIKNAEPQTEQNYINEIKLLRRLDKHDRIVRLWDYEVNRQQQTIYMVKQWADSILHQPKIPNQKGRPLNYHFIKLYWEQMLEAVEAIHQQKIVHSDLKPANFILVDGSLKLIDFGIAKAISNDTTNIHREQQVGTINYMSPEAFIQETDNINGRHLIKASVSGKQPLHGRPSDVWSLGCILYQMVYGYTPFHHLTTVLQKIAAITGPKFQVPFPSEIKDQGTLVTIDPGLHEVLQSCLQRDPRSRMTIPQLLQHRSLRPRPAAEKKAALDSLKSLTGDLLLIILRKTVNTSFASNPVYK